MTVAVARPVIVMLLPMTMCIVVMMARHEMPPLYFMILRFVHTPLLARAHLFLVTDYCATYRAVSVCV